MPESWQAKRWILHHDNALAHISLLVGDFLTKTETTVTPQPPYSLGIAPAEFFVFPKLKYTFKRRRFDTTEEIKKYAEGPEGNARTSVRELLRKLEETVGAVCQYLGVEGGEGGYFEGGMCN